MEMTSFLHTGTASDSREKPHAFSFRVYRRFGVACVR